MNRFTYLIGFPLLEDFNSVGNDCYPANFGAMAFDNRHHGSLNITNLGCQIPEIDGLASFALLFASIDNRYTGYILYYS